MYFIFLNWRIIVQLRLDLHESFDRSNIAFPFYYYEPHFASAYSILQPHWHDDIEIWYCQCNGHATLNDTHYEFSSGDIIIVNKRVIHSFEMLSPECIHIFLFDYSFLEFEKPDFCQEKILYPLKSENLLLSPYISTTHEIYNELKDILIILLKLRTSRPLGYELKSKSLLYDMLYLFYSNHEYIITKELNSKKQNVHAIQKAVTYMELHLSENITVDELCAISNISKYHFIRLFKSLTAYTPMQYLMNMRLTYAAKLLLNSEDTITIISYNMGFNNVGYFIKQFKKKYDVTPSIYRKKGGCCKTN